ncbi:MAG: GldG family protein, partial [Alphaproteobacteria bacterium]|nr:GldG family protein [Alphaproteobacteria bacterium]
MFKKYQLIILSVLALISFIGINIAVSLMFASFVIDTTPDDKYSLGEKTKVWLEGNESNIYMRLYTSGNNKEYARDVLRLLEQYRVNSDGRISIKTIDVEPLSAAEAEATKLGVKEVGNKNYIGLVVSDEEGDFASIPYLNPLRKDYLEHDITRLLSRLNNKDKKTIGVLSSEIKLTATESALDYTTDWPFLDILRNDYNISSVKNRVAYIKNDIDLLLVVNPKNLPEDTVYAIDQYLMRGGNVLIFLDPVSEVAIAEKKYGLSATSLERFLAGFGIKYDYTKIAADMKSDRMITKADNTKVSYPFWINVNFGEQSHNLFNALNTVLLNSAGYLKVFPQ